MHTNRMMTPASTMAMNRMSALTMAATVTTKRNNRPRKKRCKITWDARQSTPGRTMTTKTRTRLSSTSTKETTKLGLPAPARAVPFTWDCLRRIRLQPLQIATVAAGTALKQIQQERHDDAVLKRILSRLLRILAFVRSLLSSSSTWFTSRCASVTDMCLVRSKNTEQ
jgi:hypothetical protein